MIYQIDAKGRQCPIPMVETKKALAAGGYGLRRAEPPAQTGRFCRPEMAAQTDRIRRPGLAMPGALTRPRLPGMGALRGPALPGPSPGALWTATQARPEAKEPLW